VNLAKITILAKMMQFMVMPSSKTKHYRGTTLGVKPVTMQYSYTAITQAPPKLPQINIYMIQDAICCPSDRTIHLVGLERQW
jgi:hypothetical protein